jgi:hypothetical protein
MQKVKDSPAGAGHFVASAEGAFGATIIDTFWKKNGFSLSKTTQINVGIFTGYLKTQI